MYIKNDHLCKHMGFAQTKRQTMREKELIEKYKAELLELGKSDGWICRNIGMSADELLRLKQITGLAALFKDDEYSQSWKIK